jgi:hypothetical protein
MPFAVFALIALLTGCSEHDEATPSPPSNPELERVCTLHSVEILEDPATVADGFASAPEPWIDQMKGSFSGAVDTHLGTLEGLLDVDYNIGDVRVVRYTWDETDTECGAWYEIGFSAALSVGTGVLDELFAATLIVDAENIATFVLDIPMEDLRGSLRPNEFDEPGTKLRMEGDFKQLSWQGDLGWLGEVDEYEAWEDIGAFSFGPR